MKYASVLSHLASGSASASTIRSLNSSGQFFNNAVRLSFEASLVYKSSTAPLSTSAFGKRANTMKRFCDLSGGKNDFNLFTGVATAVSAAAGFLATLSANVSLIESYVMALFSSIRVQITFLPFHYG